MPARQPSTRDDQARSAAGETEAAEHAGSEQSKDKRTDYLTARQLAGLLQISEATVHRLRRAGRIPAIVLTNRLIRFNLRDVRQALRPAHERSHGDADADEPSPQLSFSDLYPDYNQ